jgi:glutathione S-transferase
MAAGRLSPDVRGRVGQTRRVNPIFHIALRAEWADAQAGGVYRRSTLGRSLDEVGFIHCSRRDQVELVANAVYRDQGDLVLLVIDPSRVGAEIREENVDGGRDLFPHIYGPLHDDAVIDVLAFAAGADGRFTMPASRD